MSKRYQHVLATDCGIEVFRLGEDVGEDPVDEPGHVALALGDPWASAFAIHGTPSEIRVLLTLILDVIDRETGAVVTSEQEPSAEEAGDVRGAC